MESTRIVAYQVQDDGFFDPVVFKKENLRSTEVFIFVDEGRKELWIWIGENADVRTRFISSTVATEIRRYYGNTFRIKSADQGLEPDDFWTCIDSVPLEGIGPVKDIDITPLSKNQSQEKVKLKELIPPKAPMLSGPKTKTLQKIKKKPFKTPRKSKDITRTPVPLNNFIEAKPSLVTTPFCPGCEIGHLLPFSQVVEVSTGKKELLPFAKWACSNCGFSPKTE